MSKEKTSIKKDVGARFCKFRKSIGKTQQQLADELGIYQSTITNFEQGKTFPSLKYLYHFNEKYGLDITWVITGKGDMISKDYRLHANTPPLLDTFPNFNRGDARRYSELLYLMEVPVIEQIIMAKFLELKTLMKDEIEEYYQKKKQEEMKEKSNGDEG